MTLRHGEWQLAYPGTEYVFGTSATPVFNMVTPEVGDVDLRVSDFDRPRQDGRAFGVDFRSGRSITFELGITGPSSVAVREELSRLAHVWRADPVRLTPGAVAELRTSYDGRERVVYGRPRRFAPDHTDVSTNRLATVTADFACVDDLFYAPFEESVNFGIVPALGGGLDAPLAAPLSTTRTSDRSVGIRVQTEMPTWPVIRIDGPITNPVVEVGTLFRFEVRVSINHDEFIVIDTRPWARHAMRNGTANVSGLLRGTRLAKAELPTGVYDVGFRGLDPTGTASVRLSWRPAYPSL